MKNLNNYINEAWSGVKKQTSIDIEAIEKWCEDMGIEDYTINDKGEIDVDEGVDLSEKKFKELPYKFGIATGYFTLSNNKNLISLKNCPDYVYKNFYCDQCPQLDSLEGCPKEVEGDFVLAGSGLKDQFTEKEIRSLCKVKKRVILN